MSMDYPDYRKIKEQSKFWGLVWRIGDAGYYIGIFGAVVSFVLTTGATETWLRQISLILGFVCVFLVSAHVKKLARNKSGIRNWEDS